MPTWRSRTLETVNGRLRRRRIAGIEIFALADSRLIDKHGTNSWVWPAAQAFVRYLVDTEAARQERTSPLSVLELGAGTGFVGMAFAAQAPQPCCVTLTDLPSALSILQTNASLNGAHVNVHVRELSWGDSCAAETLRNSSDFDLIIGCDVAYDNNAHGLLLHTLDQLALTTEHVQRSRVMLAIPDRDDGTLAAFLARSRSFGWEWEDRKLPSVDVSSTVHWAHILDVLFPTWISRTASSMSSRARAPAARPLDRWIARVTSTRWPVHVLDGHYTGPPADDPDADGDMGPGLCRVLYGLKT